MLSPPPVDQAFPQVGVLAWRIFLARIDMARDVDGRKHRITDSRQSAAKRHAVAASSRHGCTAKTNTVAGRKRSGHLEETTDARDEAARNGRFSLCDRCDAPCVRRDAPPAAGGDGGRRPGLRGGR